MWNRSKSIKHGFTLAETLITIVILGVISAFVLPSITSTKPSEDKLLYKKSFFTISEAVMAVVNNSDLYDTNEYDVLLYPLAPIEKDGEGNDVSTTNFCQYLTNYLNTVGAINCSGETGSFRLANGVLVLNVPINFATSCTGQAYGYKKICTLLVNTKGENSSSHNNGNSCNKNVHTYRINIAENGKVFTHENWTCENSILETGTRVQQDKE